MSKAVIKEAFNAPGNAVWPATGTGVIGHGYKDTGSFAIKPFKEIKSKSTRTYLTLLSAIGIIKGEQISAAMLKALIAGAKLGSIGASFVTSGVAKATDFTAAGGLYTFANTNSMGVGFELVLSPSERSLTTTYKRAFGTAAMAALITAAKTNAIAGALHIPALDATNIIKGYINPDLGDLTVADLNLADWKITIKTRSTPNSFDVELVSGLEVDIMIVIDNATPDDVNDYLEGGFAPELTLAMGVDTAYNLVLGAGGLTRYGELLVDDDKNQATVHYNGFYDIDFIDTTTDIDCKAQL